MIKKHVYDLTIEDLNQFPVWYFPMDATVDDETVVVPVDDESILKQDYQILVKTVYLDSYRNEYIGYIYWGTPDSIDYVKPTLLLHDFCVTFWNGMDIPEKEYINEIKIKIKSGAFPFDYESIETMGLHKITGKLIGLYYVDDVDNIQHVVI